MARRLDWRGAQIKDRVLTAARQGTDDTMAACVNDAKPNTPVVTGVLQGSERFEPAEIKGNIVEGLWGSFDVEYALPVEVGARGRPGVYMFRNSADKNYPGHAGNIKKRYGK